MKSARMGYLPEWVTLAPIIQAVRNNMLFRTVPYYTVDVMKILYDVAALLISGVQLALAEQPSSKVATDLEGRSKNFLNALSKGDVKAATAFLFKAADDPALEMAEIYAKSVGDSLSRLFQHFSGTNSNPRFQKIKASVQLEKLGRSIVKVDFWGFDPDQNELEPGDLAWILTKKSGWKLIEL